MKPNGIPAPPLRRLGAYAVDWYLSAMVCGLPLLLVNSMRTGSAAPDTSLPPDGAGVLWGTVAVLFGLAYYMLPLLCWDGRTPGKRLFGLRVVPMAGGRLTLRQVLLRQGVGLLVLEGAVIFPSQLLRELFARAAGAQSAQVLQYAMVGVTMASILLGIYTPERRMLHDRLAQTQEVYLPLGKPEK